MARFFSNSEHWTMVWSGCIVREARGSPSSWRCLRAWAAEHRMWSPRGPPWGKPGWEDFQGPNQPWSLLGGKKGSDRNREAASNQPEQCPPCDVNRAINGAWPCHKLASLASGPGSRCRISNKDHTASAICFFTLSVCVECPALGTRIHKGHSGSIYWWNSHMHSVGNGGGHRDIY